MAHIEIKHITLSRYDDGKLTYFEFYLKVKDDKRNDINRECITINKDTFVFFIENEFKSIVKMNDELYDIIYSEKWLHMQFMNNEFYLDGTKFCDCIIKDLKEI